MIRDAIDRALEDDVDDVRLRAAASLLAAEPLPVGEPEELERERDEMLDRHPPE